MTTQEQYANHPLNNYKLWDPQVGILQPNEEMIHLEKRLRDQATLEGENHILRTEIGHLLMRNDNQKRDLERLKKELAALKEKSPQCNGVRKPFICPWCKDPVDTIDGLDYEIRYTKYGVFHQQCYYESELKSDTNKLKAANRRNLARIRRRARRWRNFKLFLSRAFWSFW
jgi:hypothetical protein